LKIRGKKHGNIKEPVKEIQHTKNKSSRKTVGRKLSKDCSKKMSTPSFRSKGPSKMDEHRSTSRCICMKLKTLEDKKKILHIPEREEKKITYKG